MKFEGKKIRITELIGRKFDIVDFHIGSSFEWKDGIARTIIQLVLNDELRVLVSSSESIRSGLKTLRYHIGKAEQSWELPIEAKIVHTSCRESKSIRKATSYKLLLPPEVWKVYKDRYAKKSKS